MISKIHKRFLFVTMAGFAFWGGFLFLNRKNVVFAEGFNMIEYAKTSPGAAAKVKAISTSDASAQGILNSIAKVLGVTEKGNIGRDKYKFLWKSSVTNALYSAIENGLKTIAYDTATYIGSGGEGKKPLFITEGWGEYLSNVSSSAGGTFLEDLGKDPNFFGKFNLCDPDSSLKLKIGLNLSDQEPDAPDCTFNEMRDNWNEELSRGDFLNRFQNMFDHNDVGVVLTLNTKIVEQKNEKEREAVLFRLGGNGWISEGVNDIVGKNKTPPGKTAQEMDRAGKSFMDVMTSKDWEDPFVGAAKVFILQLLYTSFQKLLANLGDSADSFTSPYEGILNFEAGSSPNSSSIEGKMTGFIKPNFNVRGDYDILSKLSTCPDPENAGPTDCVITEKFRQAIALRLTIQEAIDDGYLDGDATFGYLSNGLEPAYNEGYPHRSMVILRKYRILPVGWEVAAQWIKDYGTDLPYTLNDLIGPNCPPEIKGFIDPSWVLKAAQNYCAREGAGPEIISKTITGEGSDSSLSITRDNGYCSDNQTCINEDDDGNCNYYGYCTEERRFWDNEADSCDAVYNTCEAYKKTGGEEIGYLENSIDVSGCNADNVGCKEYRIPTSTNYDIVNDKVDYPSSNSSEYLTKVADTCDESNEGCNTFLRTKDETGANLIVDSSFEGIGNGISLNPFYDSFYIQNTDAYDGDIYYKLPNNTTVFTFTVGGTGYNISGESYTFSFYSKNCSITTDDFFEVENSNTFKEKISSSTDWSLNLVNVSFPISITGNKIDVKFENLSTNCSIDALKLENGNFFTGYSDYMEDGITKLKILPDYLKSICTPPSSNLYQDLPEICDNFVKDCNLDNVGCSMYTSVLDGYNISAKVKAQDYCPKECIGFDTYIQTSSMFDSSRDEYFIPDTAKSCSANSVGCEKFTNLDKIGFDAEEVNYYSYLRQCVKESEAIINTAYSCEQFYDWQEDDDEKGLTAYNLKVLNGVDSPYTTGNNQCNEDIYNAPINDPKYNYDCHKLQNQDGQVFYVEYSKTVTCDNDCHPFRMERINTDDSIPQAICSTLCSAGSVAIDTTKDGCWDNINSVCNVCENGGKWDVEYQSCIYQGISKESIECNDKENGCREYSGAQGSDMEIVMTEDFEDTLTDWSGGNVTSGSMFDGSYYGSTNATILIKAISEQDQFFEEGYSYSIQFLGKLVTSGTAGDNLTITYENNNNPVDIVTWDNDIFLEPNVSKLYTVNLSDFNIKPKSGNLKLALSIATNDFYIDNFKITKITDRYNLIKDSWVTPDFCNEDIYGNPFPHHDLGCRIYKDQENKTHNLHNFNSLCVDYYVGCEQMIDTKNTLLDSTDDVFDYFVYNKDKTCSQKGCDRFGLVYNYADHSVYKDMYIVNDPDIENISCLSNDVHCEEWIDNSGAKKYFKDPGDYVFEYNNGDWYRKKVNSCGSVAIKSGVGNACDGTGDDGCYCIKDDDCDSGDCSLETDLTNSLDIPTLPYIPKTYGENGFKIFQPGDDGGKEVGLCPVGQSGCTEYISDVSTANAQIVDGATSISLDPYTLYTAIDINNNSYSFNPSSISNLYQIPASTLSYYYGDTVDSVTYSTDGKVVKAMVDYKIAPMDEGDCNGIEDIEKGCVKFYYDCFFSGCSNGFYSVRPNRECAEWLTCTTYVKDEDDNNVCLDINKCNLLGDDGQCKNVISKKTLLNTTDNQIYNKDDFSNATGFVSLAYDAMSTYSGVPNDLYPFGDMAQKGGSTEIPNGDFEVYDNLKYPLGWYAISSVTNSNPYTWDASYFYVIDNPIDAQTEGIEYIDKSFLKYSPNLAFVNSESIDVEPDTEYIISAKMNTKNFSKAQNQSIFAVIEAFAYTSNGVSLGLSSAQGGVIGQNGFDNCTDCDYVADTILENPVLFLDTQKDWTDVSARFKTSNATGRIVIYMGGVVYNNDGSLIYCNTDSSNSYCNGDFYVDDIMIKPALEIKDKSGNIQRKLNKTQECRLYPEQDSLSCKYFEDSGEQQEGQWGYCLEYDSYPGDSNTCLLWWPIDLLAGRGIEEGAGYKGMKPVYYCIDATSTPMDFSCSDMDTGANIEKIYNTPFVVLDLNHSSISVSEGGDDDSDYGISLRDYYTKEWTDMVIRTGPGDTRLWEISQDFGNIKLFDGINILCSDGDDDNEACECSDFMVGEGIVSVPECHEIIQVVTPTGQNKYWSGRVYEGSQYVIPCNREYDNGNYFSLFPQDCYYSGEDTNFPPTYTSDYSPFGAILPPANSFGELSNPSEWDSLPEVQGNQPLYYVFPPDDSFESRMGQLHNVFDVKRLFAQSYGSWKWDDNSSMYKRYDTDLWVPPTKKCIVPDNRFPGKQEYINEGYVTGTKSDGITPVTTPCFDSGCFPAGSNDCYDTCVKVMNRPGTCSFPSGTNVVLTPDSCCDCEVDWCGIPPEVTSSSVNDFTSTGDLTLSNSSFVNLRFTTKVDSQQLPLVMYAVKWGDGTNIVISGVEMSDRESTTSPYSLYHYYDKNNCSNGCQIKIKIKDNWGWYSDNNGGGTEEERRWIEGPKITFN